MHPCRRVEEENLCHPVLQCITQLYQSKLWCWWNGRVTGGDHGSRTVSLDTAHTNILTEVHRQSGKARGVSAGSRVWRLLHEPHKSRAQHGLIPHVTHRPSCSGNPEHKHTKFRRATCSWHEINMHDFQNLIHERKTWKCEPHKNGNLKKKNKDAPKGILTMSHILGETMGISHT